MTILKISNLSKSYKNSNFTIQNFNLTVSEGEIVAFIGNNGSGKSTIINSIIGNRFIDKGEIVFLNKLLDNSSIKHKEFIGVAFDNLRLPKDLNLKEINTIFSKLYSTWNSNNYFAFIHSFELPLNQKVGSFSRGMAMKLSVGIALSHDTKLLIMDESTAGIDISSRKEILHTIKHFSANKAVIIVSHIPNDVDFLATKLVFLKKGQKLFEISKEQLFNNYYVNSTLKEKFSKTNLADTLAYLEQNNQIYYINKRTATDKNIHSIEDISHIILDGELL